MERIKSINWGFVIYWFVIMSVMNAYVLPKFVDNEPITTRRVMVAIVVSLISGLVMGLFVKKKPNENNQ